MDIFVFVIQALFVCVCVCVFVFAALLGRDIIGREAVWLPQLRITHNMNVIIRNTGDFVKIISQNGHGSALYDLEKA